MIALAALAQHGRFRFDGPEEGASDIPPREAEYHFLRLEYTDLPQYEIGFGFRSRRGRGRGWWLQDWPDAEDHFSAGVERLTRIDVGDPRHASLLDDRLFDYPWIYATQTGYWNLSDPEIARTRSPVARPARSAALAGRMRPSTGAALGRNGRMPTFANRSLSRSSFEA